MHIFFSGIGGSGISALALIAKQAGYEVSGSDARPSQYLKYLAEHGITDTYVGTSYEQIEAVHKQQPIDWYVYGSAQLRDFPDLPEFKFCQDKSIRTSKRDELLNRIIEDAGLKMIAVAGTHGKTTTTAMCVWLAQQLNIPLSYSLGGKISFGDISHFDKKSQYFVYEADEYDRNFLAFHPYLSIITGVDWDHPDIYPTREDYYQAFKDFLGQSQLAVLWQDDQQRLQLPTTNQQMILDPEDNSIDQRLRLIGKVNRQDAWQVAEAFHEIFDQPLDILIQNLNEFPGLARRFEKIADNLYSDYAHTPAKIRGALQTAKEAAGKDVVVVYEGLHNTRQHFIKEDLADLFVSVEKLYIVPTYLAREDPNLPILSPSALKELLSPTVQAKSVAAQLDDQLKADISNELQTGNLVLCLTAGSGGSLDEWLRSSFAVHSSR